MVHIKKKKKPLKNAIVINWKLAKLSGVLRLVLIGEKQLQPKVYKKPFDVQTLD